jgi:hypothetical protein
MWCTHSPGAAPQPTNGPAVSAYSPPPAHPRQLTPIIEAPWPVNGGHGASLRHPVLGGRAGGRAGRQSVIMTAASVSSIDMCDPPAPQQGGRTHHAASFQGPRRSRRGTPAPAAANTLPLLTGVPRPQAPHSEIPVTTAAHKTVTAAHRGRSVEVAAAQRARQVAKDQAVDLLHDPHLQAGRQAGIAARPAASAHPPQPALANCRATSSRSRSTKVGRMHARVCVFGRGGRGS